MEDAFAQSDLHLSGCRGAQLQGKENDNTQKLYNQLFIIIISERKNRKLIYMSWPRWNSNVNEKMVLSRILGNFF